MSDFPEKYTKILNKFAGEFVDGTASKTDEEIRKAILSAEAGMYEVEQAQDADTKLTAHKDMVKELSGPYRETKSIENAKIKYCIHLLESRGQPINKK